MFISSSSFDSQSKASSQPLFSNVNQWLSPCGPLGLAEALSGPIWSSGRFEVSKRASSALSERENTGEVGHTHTSGHIGMPCVCVCVCACACVCVGWRGQEAVASDGTASLFSNHAAAISGQVASAW